MKAFCISLFLLILSCNETKKETKPSVTSPEEVSTEVEKNNEEIVPKEKVMVNNKIIAVLSNPKKLAKAKEMVKNSGFTWDKMILDKNTAKIALIEVPEKDKNRWIEALKTSGYFKEVALNSDELAKELIEKETNTLLTLNKTNCLGDCPVYSMSIDKKGNVTFNGKQYVVEKGVKEFTLTDKELTTLNEYLAKDFSSFKEMYDNPKVMDLPSTFITCNDKQIQIRLWNDDVPDTLLEMHEYLEGILLEKKYVN